MNCEDCGFSKSSTIKSDATEEEISKANEKGCEYCAGHKYEYPPGIEFEKGHPCQWNMQGCSRMKKTLPGLAMHYYLDHWAKSGLE